MVSITIPFRIQLLPQCLCYKRVNKIYNLKTAILLYFTTELMKAILCIEDIQASSSSGELNFGTFFLHERVICLRLIFLEFLTE
jgi:hypothetical protein